MKKNTPQKSAFLISHYMRKEIPVDGRIEVKTHEVPLLILSDYKEVLAFLSRYTQFIDFCKDDRLAAKWELKSANFHVEITNYDLLEKEILCDPPKSMTGMWAWFREYYPEHSLDITRLPLGIYKKQLFPDYY